MAEGSLPELTTYPKWGRMILQVVALPNPTEDLLIDVLFISDVALS